MTDASEAPTQALQVVDPTEVLALPAPLDPWEQTWVVPTQNSVYEVDFCRQRARQVSGDHTTECFTPQGEWKTFMSCQIGYGGTLIFNWTLSAPHALTTTSAIRPGGIRYSTESTD